MLPLAREIAQAILSGFDQHYLTFLQFTQGAQVRFESGDWVQVQSASAERIKSYDNRVNDTVKLLKNRFGIGTLDEHIWHWVKSAYIRLLQQHRQPELAESFYNSLFCRMFDRRYFNNDNIFVRTQVDPESFSESLVYTRYPLPNFDAQYLRAAFTNLPLDAPFADLDQDLQHMQNTLTAQLQGLEPPVHLDLLQPLFYRNKAAYLIGRISNDQEMRPFLVPILRNEQGQLYTDCLITDPEEVAIIFGFARAYFMVDSIYPGAIVHFLKSILPGKTAAELYTSLGLQKHGKTLFYRDFLQHLSNTDDQFIIAPGIKGMVMAVFTLPSYPFVFKLIKDKFAPQKAMTKATVIEKYQLIKQHDRVGRMADTWEFSHVAFPRERFSEELIEELQNTVASQLRIDEEHIVLRHCYIERRMKPLNLFLDDATDENDIRHALQEYGDAIKQIAGANIFPGDMLFKNFGVTRHGRVIFYDYDEICYLTDCNFRRIPPPRYPEDEMAAEPWYSVAENDIFPEEFSSFLLCDPKTRKIFKQLHPDLLSAELWQEKQQNVRNGVFEDVYPYCETQRFYPER